MLHDYVTIESLDRSELSKRVEYLVVFNRTGCKVGSDYRELDNYISISIHLFTL